MNEARDVFSLSADKKLSKKNNDNKIFPITAIDELLNYHHHFISRRKKLLLIILCVLALIMMGLFPYSIFAAVPTYATLNTSPSANTPDGTSSMMGSPGTTMPNSVDESALETNGTSAEQNTAPSNTTETNPGMSMNY